jgi:FAD:protein FMN transferase
LREFLLCVLALTFVPCMGSERYEFVQPHMGTLFKIILFSSSADEAKSAAAQAFKQIALLDQTLSDYQPDSELMRLSRSAPAEVFKLSPELFEVLRYSQTIAAQTDDAFDITIGSVTHLWRRARRADQLPSLSQQIVAARTMGSEKLQLDIVNRTATLRAPNMQLDLGGIAKGYAADRALAVLTQNGIKQAMVAASGDLALGDAPPGALGWRIDIAAVHQNIKKPLSLIATNVGISTSGDAEQFVEVAGKRHSHIINPRTAASVTESVTATVIAPNATWADGFATAYSVLDASSAKRIALDSTVPIRVILQNRNHSKTEHLGRKLPGLISAPI